METKKIVFEKISSDPWLDEMTEEQYKKLKEVVGSTIIIKKGFAYDNKTYGRTVCIQYELEGAEYYSTEFGSAIVRQFENDIKPVLDAGDAVEVKVVEFTSKKFKSKYVAFDSA